MLDATNAWSWHVSDLAELRGLNEMLIEQARRRAQRARPAGLDPHPRPADLRRGGDRCRVRAAAPRLLRGVDDARLRPGAERRPLGQLGGDGGHPAAAPRGGAAAGFPQLRASTRSRRAWRTASRRCCSSCTSWPRRRARRRWREFAELEAFAGRKLDAWDVGFYAERLQRERFSVSQEELRPYFPLPRVLDRAVRGRRAAVRRAHPRARRRAGVAPRRALLRHHGRGAAGRSAASTSTPTRAPTSAAAPGWTSASAASAWPAARRCRWPTWCAISCPRAQQRPALLTHDDVVTLFHEFGHGLHHLLTRVDYPSLAGINGVAWDAVELPSQFLENYAWQPEVLQRICAHFASGAPLPADTAGAPDRHAQLPGRAADGAAAGVRAVRFPHPHRVLRRSAAARVREILSRGAAARWRWCRCRQWNRFANSFGHIFAGGYAAGYYSYKWAEVLAADAFAAFEENGRVRPPRPRSAFSMRSSAAAAAAMRSRRSSNFAAAARTSRALLRQHGIARRGRARRVRGASGLPQRLLRARGALSAAGARRVALRRRAGGGQRQQRPGCQRRAHRHRQERRARGSARAAARSGPRALPGGEDGWIRASYLSADEPLRPRLAARDAELAR